MRLESKLESLQGKEANLIWPPKRAQPEISDLLLPCFTPPHTLLSAHTRFGRYISALAKTHPSSRKKKGVCVHGLLQLWAQLVGKKPGANYGSPEPAHLSGGRGGRRLAGRGRPIASRSHTPPQIHRYSYVMPERAIPCEIGTN